MRQRGFKPNFTKIPAPFFSGRKRSNSVVKTRTTRMASRNQSERSQVQSPKSPDSPSKVDVGEAILAAEWNNPANSDIYHSFNKTTFQAQVEAAALANSSSHPHEMMLPEKALQVTSLERISKERPFDVTSSKGK